MRASRLLSILMLLQSRRRMTARELAKALEVSERTIHRDIDELSASGVPVFADRGPNGGFSLLDGYRTRLTGLNTDEARALFLVGLPGPAAQLGMGGAVAAAQLKLLAALPVEGSAAARSAGDRFHLDPLGWFQGADATDRVPLLAEAVWNARVIEVRYRRWTGPVERRLQPLGLVLKAGIWYLMARSDGSVRTYRVERILDLVVGDETFERPADFDLAAEWKAFAARYEASVYTGSAKVRASARGLDKLSALAPEIAARVRVAHAGEPFEIPIESVAQIADELMRIGDDVEALAPPELRQRLAECARRIGARYSAG